jgi:hypothetical protein
MRVVVLGQVITFGCAWMAELVGFRWPSGPDAQGSLEGGHWSPPPVEPKHELVEVGLELVLGDPAIGTAEPGLEVADDAVGTRQRFAKAQSDQQSPSQPAPEPHFRRRCTKALVKV